MSVERCDHCGRRLDRPTWDEECPSRHAPAKLADVIVRGIERELDDRRGMGWDYLDADVLDEVRDALTEVVAEALDDHFGGCLIL